MARGYVTEADGLGGHTSTAGAYGVARRASWGAVLAGVVVMIIIQLLLAVLGVGIGLTAIDPTSLADNPSASNASLVAAGYWAVSVIISTYIGAFVAGRLAGSPNRTDGMLHGIVAWATATLLLIYVLTSGTSSLISGVFSTFGSTLQTLGQGVGSLPGGASQLAQVLPDDLRAKADALFQRGQQQAQQAGQQAQQQGQQAQQAAGAPTPTDAIRKVIAGVRDGASPEDHQAAVNVIAQQAGIPPDEADRRLGDFQNSYRQSVGEAQAKAKDAAVQSRSALSKTAFVLAAALLIGLIVAMIGGRAGAPDDDYDHA